MKAASGEGGVVCTVLYSLSVIGTIVSAVWCMKTDPSDPGLRAKREAALTGADVVIIPAGVPRKPGMTRDDLFNTNASIVASLDASVRASVLRRRSSSRPRASRMPASPS